MVRFIRNVGFYLLIIFVAITLIDYFTNRTPTRMEMNYSSFIQEVDNGKVSKVVIVENTIRGTLSDGTEFDTVLPTYPGQDGNLIKTLQAKNVEIKAENPPEPPWWTTLLSSLLPILLLVGVWR